MREILFRGKSIDGTWHYGVPLVYTEDYVCIAAPHSYNKKVESITIGQYTGLTDKNGKKIFEGDIVTENSGDVRLLCDINEKKGHIGVVKFGEHSVPSGDPFYWGEAYGFFVDGEVFTPAISSYGHYYDYDLEVIGNIYDNPELMKGGV